MVSDRADGPGVRPEVRCLSFHADYACQNSGVCCSSSWEIAVEERVELDLKQRLSGASVRLPRGPDGFRPMVGPPHGCKSRLRRHEPSGSCWFHDAEAHLCGIHRAFGEDSLPSACRQFPRICVLEPGLVSVSLSHHCPTAAALLFRESADFEVVVGAPAFPGTWPFEGLDARGAYPPFLRKGVLLGFDGLRAFEESAVKTLKRGDVWLGLARIEAAVESIRGWTPERGLLGDLIRSSFSEPGPLREPGSALVDPRAILLSSLTEEAPTDALLPDFRSVAPAVSAPMDLALRRYLAARLIAGWITFQADDLRTVANYLRLCLNTVLLFESGRGRQEPEADRWKEAIRSADLWVIHYCDPDLLARNLR